MQKLTIIGNIGKDAEIFNHSSGQFLGITVACTTRKKNGNEVQETTNWYDCTTDNIKLLDYLKKGTKVYVEGRFKLSVFHSETSNKWIPKINLFASTLELLSAKKEENGQAPKGHLGQEIPKEHQATIKVPINELGGFGQIPQAFIADNNGGGDDLPF
ncbi:single-stranded DNA-binding protein [Emticicia fontis]